MDNKEYIKKLNNNYYYYEMKKLITFFKFVLKVKSGTKWDINKKGWTNI